MVKILMSFSWPKVAQQPAARSHSCRFTSDLDAEAFAQTPPAFANLGVSPLLCQGPLWMAKRQRIWGLNWGFWFYMSVCSQRVHVGSVVLLWRRQVTGAKYYCQKGNRGADHFLCTYLIVNYTMVIIGWLSFVPIVGNSKAVFLSKQIICDNSGVGLFAVNI